MKIKFKDIEEAYDFVSFGQYGDHTALLDKSSGKIYWRSEMGDSDEIPDEIWESDDTIEIPNKNDLDLGNQLVFDFVKSHALADYEKVRAIFDRRGAYARYKNFLESNGLLQKWDDYEEERQEKALRDWCEENKIELDG